VLGGLKTGMTVSPLFSAFRSGTDRTRIEMGEGKVLLTTESLYRRKVDKIRAAPACAEHILLVSEPGEGVPWHARSARADGAGFGGLQRRADEAEDPSLLHFTSGTTGTPKGAVHVHGAVLTHYATGKFALDLHPEDIFWCTADPGWVTGTSYGIIAPLLHGVTSIVDEADFDAERWYRIFRSRTSPCGIRRRTAIRMLMKAGPEVPRKYSFPKLRFIASVGEPLNPEAVWWGKEVLGLPIHDNWCRPRPGES